MPYEKFVVEKGGLPFYIGLSTDIKPVYTSEPIGAKAYEADTNLTYIAGPSGWYLAGLAISPMEVPRLAVTPEIGGTPARKLIKNTNAASSTILGFRYSIAPGDDVVAGGRLAEQLTDTWLLSPGDTAAHIVISPVAFSVYVAAVANVAYANAAGTILPTGTTAANTRTAMSKLDYGAGVQLIELTCHESYQIASVTYALLSMGGGEDA